MAEIGGARLQESLPGRQGRQLFAFLVLNRYRTAPRSEIIEALWSGRGPDAADAALSVLLSRLRKVLGPVRLDGRRTVRLILGDAWVDIEVANESIHRAESAVAGEEWARAWVAAQAAMFTARRGFLAGEEGEWIDDVRRRLDVMHLRALEAYGAACLGLGGTELAAAREAGRALVRIAPFRESGHRLLMRALVAEGNTAEAFRIFESLRLTLVEELGISPSEQTQLLYEQLLG